MIRSYDKNMKNRTWASWTLAASLGLALPVWAQQASMGALVEGGQAGAAVVETPQPGFAEQIRPTRGKQAQGTLYNRPYEPVKVGADEADIPEIVMFVGESRVFPAPGVGRIAVGNGSILTAAALDGKEVILFANGAGTSSLFIWNEDGRYQRVKINIVAGDTSRIAREISAFLDSVPAARTAVIGDKVIVEGEGLSDAELARIDLLSKHYPQIVNFTNPQGFEQMVMIDVKVVEFPISEFRELGLRWNAVGGTAIGAIWSPFHRRSGSGYQVNLQSDSGTSGPPISASTGLVPPRGLNVLSVVNMGLNATLSALAQEGKTVILAEPQLSARNGAQASFLAGGEYPYVVSNVNGSTVQFKPYGVRLDIQPRVDREGNVRATVETEVSTIDHSVATIAGPGLLTNKTSTEFDVRSGETIVLSGLLQRFSSDSVDKVPFLGDIPIIGALFRSKRYQNRETELVFFVTPTVISASSAGVLDRIERTYERLGQRLGPIPHLSDPLQPEADPARMDQSIAIGLPPADEQPVPVHDAAVQPRGQAPQDAVSEAPAAPGPATEPAPVLSVLLSVVRDGAVLHELPDPQSRVLGRLDTDSQVYLRDQLGLASALKDWQPVWVNGLSGWVSSRDVQQREPRP